MADLTKTIDGVIAQDETGAAVPITDQTGEPLLAADGSPATVTVLGRESKRVRAAVSANTSRMLRGRKAKLDAADIRANRVAVAIAAVTGWHGFEVDGADAPCTEDNLRAFFRAEYTLEQVESAISGHADFFTTSSTD